MQKPNLFSYATSELSQDAIICWLLEWGKPENKDINLVLHQIAKLFLDSLFDKSDDIETPSQYHTIKIIKQHKSIDVLCLVNDQYALIIEDKTNTKNHSNQLKRYLENTINEFDTMKVLPIYFKTGDQSHYDNVDKAYKIYLRRDFLKVLQSDCSSDILVDYRRYLQKIEDSINSYKVLPLDRWTYGSVKGFYMALQKELGDGNWDYVANASGGFLGFWWNNHKMDGYRIYMQIDMTKKKDIAMQLKFKLASGTKEKVDKNIINKWKKHILFDDNEYIIKKPNVVRAGRWTTIGILENEFRVTESHGKVNIQETVASIRKIEQILREKINTLSE